MGRGRSSTVAGALRLMPRRLGLFALGMLLAGCAPQRASTNTDPLLGGAPVPRNGPTAGPPPAVAVAPPQPLVGPPPLPPPSGALSPAALAVGGASPDASSLRMGPPPPPMPGPPQPSPVLTSATHDGGDPWHSIPPPGGATLKGPETISDSPTRPIAAIAPPISGGSGAAGFSPPPAARDSYADLQDKLAQRKVMFQSLEGPDEQGAWRFSCGVPSREQPGAVHRIELTALGDHGLAAMRAGIDQIDSYQR